MEEQQLLNPKFGFVKGLSETNQKLPLYIEIDKDIGYAGE
jgi:hypothetical protein